MLNRTNLFNWAFAGFTILVVAFFYKNILLTTILVSLIAIIGLVKWKSRRTFLTFIFGGLFGAFAEMFVINFGAWNYSIINFYNIPLWLFIVWGNVAAFIYQTAKDIKERKLKELEIK